MGVVSRECWINSCEPVNGDNCAETFQKGGGDTRTILDTLNHVKQICLKLFYRFFKKSENTIIKNIPLLKWDIPLLESRVRIQPIRFLKYLVTMGGTYMNIHEYIIAWAWATK